MQSTISELLSAENEVRRNAEAKIKEQYNSNPAGFAQGLIQGLAKESPQEVATLSCVLLKKYFLDARPNPDFQVTELSEDDIQQLLQSVIQTLDFDTQPLLLLKRKGEVLAKLYSKLGQQNLFIQLLAQESRAADLKRRQFAMYGFEIMSELHLTSDQMTANKADFSTIFVQALQDDSILVRCAALKAITAFLSGIDDQDVVMEFEPILALLIQTVQLALVDDEDNGRQALDSLCELTGAHPEVWKNNTDKLLDTITKILQVKTYEPGTRSAAIEVVLSLSEEMPAALRKSAVTNQFFVELSQMLTVVELDEIEWTSSVESKDNLGTDVYSTAVSAITRFSKDIGEKKTLEANKSEIMKKIQSANWVDRQAGYTCLGLIAESCADYFKKELEQSFNLAKMGVSDSHYRVKYAALGAMANLFAVCAPTAQSRYHTEVLPVLIQLMLTEPFIKMQTQSTATVLSFVTNLLNEDEDSQEDVNAKDIMAPYCKQLLQALVALLQKSIQQNYEPLQTEALQLLSSVAQVILEEFSVYYNDFIPLMIEILEKCGQTSMPEKSLRAKAIDTIGSIIIAVTDSDQKDEFKASVMQIADYLSKLIQSGLSDDDPQDAAAKDTLTQCAGFLRAEFGQFMPYLMVPIVHDANLELDFKMEAAELPQTTENMALKVKVKGLGEQRVSLNTENLVKKTAAFALIQQVSENMGTAFAPYVEQLLPIIVQNTSFDHSKQIKKLALKSFTNMLVAVGEPKNIELNQSIFAQYTQSLEKALGRHDENSAKIMVKALANNLRALNKHNTQRRDFLTQAQIETLGPLLKATCDLVASVKSATKIVLSQTKKNFEMDEEDVERIKEDLAKMTTVTTQVMELTGQLVEIFKTGAEQTVRTGAFSYFASILNDYNSVTEDEVIDALCFFCDFIEHTSYDTPTVVQLAQKYLEIGASKHGEDDNVKHTVAYGLGEFGYLVDKQSFAPLLSKAVQNVKMALIKPDAFEEERMVTTENSLGALAKLCYKHIDGSILTHADLVSVLNRMPFTSDENESMTSHRILLDQIENPGSVIHHEVVKPAAQQAVSRIRQHIVEQGPQPEERVLDLPNIMRLEKLSF